MQRVPDRLPKICSRMIGPVSAMAPKGAAELLQGIFALGLGGDGLYPDRNSFRRLASMLRLLSQGLIHLFWPVARECMADLFFLCCPHVESYNDSTG
jgi:hypothetical protein